MDGDLQTGNRVELRDGRFGLLKEIETNSWENQSCICTILTDDGELVQVNDVDVFSV